MASVRRDSDNIVIGLSNAETNDLIGTLTGLTGGSAAVVTFFAKIGITAALGAAGPYIAAAIVAHVAWEVGVIKLSNKGDGVWLYASHTIWSLGGMGIVIPQTRTASSTFDGNADDGTMHSEHADEITWHIDRGVGDPDDCKFVLVNECDWDKAYELHIGQDTWWVQANGHQSAENGAWANQLPQTQIVFQKPQFLGKWGPAALTISNFAGLKAQDITTFRWVKDT